MTFSSGAIRLACNVNNYHWGKHGLSSKAAQFAATNPGVAIDENQTYAELWMGTHPNGPSKVFGTNTSLSSIVDADPLRALSKPIVEKFGSQLPFLFKVLSIEKALSIQAHPNKSLAKQLYDAKPNIYKDPNHKPEMSIALTEFIAMSGFRPLEEISHFLDSYPEFRQLVKNSAEEFQLLVKNPSGSTVEDKKAVLKQLFAELMDANNEDVKIQLDNLLTRVQPTDDIISVDSLVHRLNEEYPGDVGIFCVFVLNILKLQQGQAFYMGPNDPHAYIFGDCVECMATSDNVVRAGLTPKLRDVPVLVDMLTYDFGTPEGKLLEPKKFLNLEHSLVYDPPIDEFSVVRTSLDQAQTEVVEPLLGPQILLVTEGSGLLVVGGESLPLDPGFVYFIFPGNQACIQASSGSHLVTYTAVCLA